MRLARFPAAVGVVFALAFFAGPGQASATTPPPAKVEVAVALSTSGEFLPFGSGSVEGIQFAIEEANASGSGPRIELKIYDDQSTAEGAKAVATRIASTPAILTLGPSNSATSLAAGPIFAEAGIPAITTTATSDRITDHATTFRMVFRNSDQGELLATYLHRVLGQRQATVLVMDDSYGRTIEQGFRAAAERLGLEANYVVFKNGENIEERTRATAVEIGERPVVLAMLDAEGAKVLTVLRRLGSKAPMLGADAFGMQSFNSVFANLPEEKAQPGYFTQHLYGIAPMLLDSANAELLSFAERFRSRFGHNPDWVAVAGYDAGRLAVEIVRKIEPGTSDVPAMRAAALHYLRALNDPARATQGLLGPFAFDVERGRLTNMRIGRFNQGRLESAPLQIASVLNPHETEIKSGAVFEIHSGSYARLEQVIYSGLYLNELMWIDQSHFTFTADFYIWLRFARNSGPEAADPTEIKFPDLAKGSFDREHPVESRDMPDGTSYRLWRVQGEFRNTFDLHRYPFDRQTLKLRFFNARAAADRIVYALDQCSTNTIGGSASAGHPLTSGFSSVAFDTLSQWTFVDAHQQRENFVADSSLGDPRRIGRQNFRELSGYSATIELRRRSLPTLIKSLLPLWLMTCILYASLHFPPVLVQPKIGVAMTAVLTGMVLLNQLNSQLGSIGYTVAVEYAFYVYFALGLLQIVSVLVSEHLRAVGRAAAADRSDVWTRVIFIGAVCSLCVAAALYD